METIYSIVREAKTVYSTDKTIQRKKITSSGQCRDIFNALIGDKIELQEVFYIMLLNRANEVIAVQKISEGGQAGTVVDTKRIIKSACDLLACAVIICHNHPSGNLKPSNEDIVITNKIKEVLAMIDIKLLDHLIITGDYSYYSFSDEGMM